MTKASDLRSKAKPDPARVAKCDHVQGLYWYASPHDERGWFCVDCSHSPGEPPGYSPQHDRDNLETKVGCILHDLNDAEIVSVSNASAADGIIHAATQRCRDERTLDSESIARVLLEIIAGDGKFWRERHESILAGRDNRDRCACGQLSTMSVGSGSGWDNYCSSDACRPKRGGNAPW